MKTIEACNLCGSGERRMRYRQRDLTFPGRDAREYEIFECVGCGLFYLSPQAETLEELLRIYPQDYEAYAFSRRWVMALRRLSWRRELRSLLAVTAPESRILEVGCATGEFLELLRRHGRPHVQGIELNPEAAAHARQRYGLDVRDGDLLDADLPAGAYDLIIMRHVLEHVSDPLTTLRRIHALLAPGGRLVVSLPNPDSLDARVFGATWRGHEVPRHFYNFPRRTLAAYLQKAGLRLEREDHSVFPNDWIVSTRYWLTDRGWTAAAKFFSLGNPVALVAFAPLGLLSGLLRRSTQVRYVAVRP